MKCIPRKSEDEESSHKKGGLLQKRIGSKNPLARSFIVTKCFLDSRQGDIGHTQVCNVNEEDETSVIGERMVKVSEWSRKV